MTEELTWLPAWRLRDMMAAKEVSPVEVVDHFLARIEEFDPKLHAFAHLDAVGARAQAKLAEQEVLRGSELGTLHGVPTSVKEHIAVAGMPRMALGGVGHAVVPRDDFGIERLRRAGAIVVGTNTMMGSGGGADRGESAGVFAGFNWEVEARNPWNTERVPGWSSSGGAASAAAALLPFTIGSDGGGSTRLPAAYSGVVGVHPTGGLLANVDYDAPTVPLGVTIGPLARDVRDAAVVLQAMAGPDGRDPFSRPEPADDYVTTLADGIEGWRFGWTDDFGFASTYASDDSPAVIGTVREAAQGIGALGAAVEPVTEEWEDFWPHTHVTDSAYQTGASRGFERPPAAALQAALEVRGRNFERFARLFGSVDLLLSPTAQRVARSVEEWDAAWTTEGSSYPGGTFAPTYTSHTFMFNWLRFPAVSVPCGFVDGMPVGLQIVGFPGNERKILRAAHAFQAAFPVSERPAVS